MLVMINCDWPGDDGDGIWAGQRQIHLIPRLDDLKTQTSEGLRGPPAASGNSARNVGIAAVSLRHDDGTSSWTDAV
jgi:hypothetical protein